MLKGPGYYYKVNKFNWIKNEHLQIVIFNILISYKLHENWNVAKSQLLVV